MIVPCIGRIASIRPAGGDNLVRLDPGLHGRVPDPDRGETWINFGGDWLWPVAQSRWKEFAGSDWPPPPVLAERPWSGTAWKGADGSSSCLLTRDYGEPLNIRVSRQVRLEGNRAAFTIRQGIERTAPSAIPVVLWNITQVGGARSVVLPSDTTLPSDKGYRVLMFDPPGENQVTACEGAVVYDATAGEHKLGSDSPRAWIAALKGKTVIIERIVEETGQGTRPDGGCSVEMYSNAGLGYTEIETLSVESDLGPGERIQNTLSVECAVVREDAPCAFADFVRRHVGEVPVDIVPPAEVPALP